MEFKFSVDGKEYCVNIDNSEDYEVTEFIFMPTILSERLNFLIRCVSKNKRFASMLKVSFSLLEEGEIFFNRYINNYIKHQVTALNKPIEEPIEEEVGFYCSRCKKKLKKDTTLGMCASCTKEFKKENRKETRYTAYEFKKDETFNLSDLKCLTSHKKRR